MDNFAIVLDPVRDDEQIDRLGPQQEVKSGANQLPPHLVPGKLVRQYDDRHEQ